MKYSEKITFIPYRQEDEPQRKAAVAHVPFDTTGLSEVQIQILGHLVQAANWMNPIFRDQFEPRTEDIRRFVHAVLPVAEGEEKRLLRDYAVMLDLQNSPYSLMPRKNCLLDIPLSRLKQLAEKAGGRAPDDLASVRVLMTMGFSTPDRANFYNQDIGDEDLAALGEGAGIVNSSVLRDAHGEPFVLLNEERYAEALEPVIDHLSAARDLCEDADFKLYLDAKILELQTGSAEARRIADYLWIRHSSPVDIIISTAVEVYLDNYKNARGAASAAVMVTDRKAEELLSELVARVPQWEKTAPWKYRKEEFRKENLPKLKFVDVLTWSGDYVTGPLITLAQSLPNDEWISSHLGTVNMVYGNTGYAAHRIGGHLAAERLLTEEAFQREKDILFEANQLHSALHEIGHTTGLMDPAHRKGQPRDYFQEEYSFLEETRAELFGLWALELLLRDGIIDERKHMASYDDFLITLVMSLKFDPVQAHNMARNWIFHYFSEKEAVSIVETGDEVRFKVEYEKAIRTTEEMLSLVADLKSSGNRNEVTANRKKYVFTDPLKERIEKRTADFPLGRGVIFPEMKIRGDRFTGELEYPEWFCGQTKFNLPLKQ